MSKLYFFNCIISIYHFVNKLFFSLVSFYTY